MARPLESWPPPPAAGALGSEEEGAARESAPWWQLLVSPRARRVGGFRPRNTRRGRGGRRRVPGGRRSPSTRSSVRLAHPGLAAGVDVAPPAAARAPRRSSGRRSSRRSGNRRGRHRPRPSSRTSSRPRGALDSRIADPSESELRLGGLPRRSAELSGSPGCIFLVPAHPGPPCCDAPALP